MNRIKFLLVVGLAVVGLSFSLNAEEVYYRIEDKTITFNLRADLLYVESGDNSKGDIIENFSDSVIFDEFNAGFIIKIDTLKTNIQELKKSPKVTRCANVLENTSGSLLIPTGEIFVCPKSGINEKMVLDELTNYGVQVVSSEPLYKDSSALSEKSRSILFIKLNAELNNILEIVNVLWESPKFEFVEPNFVGQLGGPAGVRTKQNARFTTGLTIRQTARTLKITIPDQSTRQPRIALYNLAGRHQDAKPIYGADGIVSVPLSNVAPGSYILRVHDGKNKWERRFLAR